MTRMLVRTRAVIECVFEVEAATPAEAFATARERYDAGDWGQIVTHRFGPGMVDTEPSDRHGVAYFVEPFTDIASMTTAFVVRLADGRAVAHGDTAAEALAAIPAGKPKSITARESEALHG